MRICHEKHLYIVIFIFTFQIDIIVHIPIYFNRFAFFIPKIHMIHRFKIQDSYTKFEID